MVRHFLFELGCEELPSKAVSLLGNEISAVVKEALDNAGLHYSAVQPFASPRRIALLIRDLQEEQPSQRLVKRGPAVNAAYDKSGNPSSALLGFARSCGVEPHQLQPMATEKGEFLVFETTVPGAKTAILMPTLIQKALTALSSFQPMRWGDGTWQFARPVHWVVMLYGEEILPWELFGCKTDRLTYGHRFHYPEAISLLSPDDYESSLEKAYVIANFAKRKQRILTDVQDCAKSLTAQPLITDDLLNEITAIVEWPQVFIANFEASFLTVPKEVLVTAMQVHQKSVALQSVDGHLLPHFIGVSNIISSNSAQMIQGNEKVMQARLNDAAFFFEQDKKFALESRIPATQKVIFQHRLGSLYEKTKRMEALASIIAISLSVDQALMQRAVVLSHCDLMTGMVNEFPELQGLMGYYYANHDKEPKEVAVALQQQYFPRFSGDILPDEPIGLIVSLVNRLDTLVGIFGIGSRPTGVKDPFKLRRHALAVGRLLLSIPQPLHLSDLIQKAVKAYTVPLDVSPAILVEELKDFIFERLLAYYQGEGISNDKVHAARACQSDWLYDMDQRLRALHSFIGCKEAAALSAACKRVGNLLRQMGSNAVTSVKPTLLVEPAEKALYQSLMHVKEDMERGNYEQHLLLLATLREPIDCFFDQVMVMVDSAELKNNRLALLSLLQESLQSVADISLLQL